VRIVTVPMLEWSATLHATEPGSPYLLQEQRNVLQAMEQLQ